MGCGWGPCQLRRYIAIIELESAAQLEFGQQATRVYDPEESATLLAIGQSQAKKQLRRYLAMIELESAARLEIGQQATSVYDPEENANLLAIGQSYA